jgi:hypothetical protein
MYKRVRQRSSLSSNTLVWIAACIATSLPMAAAAAAPSLSSPNPCATAAPAVAAPQRAKASSRAVAKPAVRKTITVGVQPGAVRKPKQPGARPRVTPSVAKATPPQDGCMSAPVGVPLALTALLGNAAPVAAYPQSIIPPFAVPLEGVPAVVDGPVDTGAPVLQQPAPAVVSGAANFLSALLPLVAVQHYPSPIWTNAGGRPTVPPMAQTPTETDREIEWPEVPATPGMPGAPELPEMPGQPGLPELPGLPEMPIGGPDLEPSLPPLPTAEVPEPASLALVMLAGLLTAATQGLRRRQSARRQA